jgi:hypothetical protein
MLTARFAMYPGEVAAICSSRTGIRDSTSSGVAIQVAPEGFSQRDASATTGNSTTLPN